MRACTCVYTCVCPFLKIFRMSARRKKESLMRVLRCAWIVAEGSEYFQRPWGPFRKSERPRGSSQKDKITEYEVDKIACTNASSELLQSLLSEAIRRFDLLYRSWTREWATLENFQDVSRRVSLSGSNPLITLNREDCRSGDDNRRRSGSRFVYPTANRRFDNMQPSRCTFFL